jgi:hypothetical protein
MWDWPSSTLERILGHKDAPKTRMGASEGSRYVRTVMRIYVQAKFVVITLSKDDTTLVVVIVI